MWGTKTQTINDFLIFGTCRSPYWLIYYTEMLQQIQQNYVNMFEKIFCVNVGIDNLKMVGNSMCQTFWNFGVWNIESLKLGFFNLEVWKREYLKFENLIFEIWNLEIWNLAT